MTHKLFLGLLSFVFTLGSMAGPKEEGLKVAKKMEAANSGFIGESSNMEMVLIDAHGSKITRVLKGKTLEVKGDGDKSISTFLNPKDVKGTKMLTWSHKDKSDDQWLYLPSSRRAKKISSRGQSGSFMGSEFSFEDLGSQEVDKYNFKLVKEGTFKKQKVWVLERVPKKKSGYTKVVLYVSKKLMNPLKINYYDRKKELLKVAEASNYKAYKVKGKTIYRADKIHMKNVQTKKESIFLVKSRKLGIKHKSREFKKSAL